MTEPPDPKLVALAEKIREAANRWNNLMVEAHDLGIKVDMDNYENAFVGYKLWLRVVALTQITGL